ncbi:MAG: polymerase LigD, ligase domain protein [Frankiales bacterium]|nr:polymerase LigD, ligase domain protein [Frankiales bacterium]
MAAGLGEYRRKRDASVTPEPVPAEDAEAARPSGNDDTFVIQEHHARALHWDFRLERNGVLVSWALPKGLPTDPKRNHLAVHTEDHPMDYAAFAGEIPARQYGAGAVSIWDRGRYATEKWTDDEVKVVLDGGRAQGRYVLIHTDGKNWLIHRMDPMQTGSTTMPTKLSPMLAIPAPLPEPGEDAAWAYETKWDGARALAFVDGGRLRLVSRNDLDVSVSYPELQHLGAALGSTQVVLDGELVCFDSNGRPSFARLQRRMHVTSRREAQQLSASYPVVYVIFDLLYLDGADLTGLSYTDRRQRLRDLGLNADSWLTPPAVEGTGAQVLQASKEQGLEGIVAKRRSSRYLPGKRTADWRKIKNVKAQEVLIAGWKPGSGRRAGMVGSLLLGIPGEDGLRYVGKVGTGFTEAMLLDLGRQFERLSRKTSPFAVDVPRADSRDAHWVRPSLVGEVAFSEWTPDGRLRHPSWRGLRPDKSPAAVVVEQQS